MKEKLSNHYAVYTDGSEVAAAAFFSYFPDRPDCSKTIRPRDRSSVFSSELEGIALVIRRMKRLSGQYQHFVIHNDSLYPGKELLAALRNEDLSEIDRLLNLMDPIYHILYEALPEAFKIILKSSVVKWVESTTNLDPKTCQKLLKPAAVSGSIEAVEALLNQCVVLNLPCSDGNPVLVVAMACPDKSDLMKMIKFLVRKGANVNRSHGEYSPLLLASLKYLDVVPYLLQNGADVNEVGDKLGNTPLTAAVFYYRSRCSTDCCSIVEILLSAGADPNKPNCNGETALHLADQNEIRRLLIRAGADLEARNIHGRTPLLKAVYTGKTDVIKMLNEYGADMAAVDNHRNSALHIMVEKSDEPQKETLRLFAFQCNQINTYGKTPLMLAAQRGCEKTIKILMELGADPNIVTYESGEHLTALSVVLDRHDSKYKNLFLAFEELITRSSMTGLPRCCCFFFKMIVHDERRLVQLMMMHGMAPLCESTRTVRQIVYSLSVRLRGIPGKVSPLAVALVSNRLAIAQYLTENWFLTPADLVGSLELRQLRSELERTFQADALKYMDENLSQPMSLLKLSFVAVSAQLGGVAGREESVSQTPLPNILKDKLLFRHEQFPMDFTNKHTPNPLHA
ncbi:ankyrin repeat domain-containing protein 17 [Plakobranchus ocellatus]|uniref:Ankyrin repeat domain-containing protein 17 n=1 Tax=Plakobranchus ocellatus TaxID=259542 RepID=A0AAV3YRK1_9GAST|nr:ankyrin repeat domain-containing protein 17 [Plakobranchus ocellatus]